MPAFPPLLGSTGSTTLVLAVVLVALGVVLLVVAAWLVRATRTDPPVLGPLEVMGTRRFARQDPATRAAMLAAARPPGAWEPAPMVPIEDEVPEDERDAGGARVAELLAAMDPQVVAANGDAEAADDAAAHDAGGGTAAAVADDTPTANGDLLPAASGASAEATSAEAPDGEPVAGSEDTNEEAAAGEVVEAEELDAEPEPAAADAAIVDATIVEDGEVVEAPADAPSAGDVVDAAGGADDETSGIEPARRPH